MKEAVAKVQASRKGVIWIEEMVDKPTVLELYSGALVFCCPSIYEPFGIINLEAMACETAVVATAVGGIKEVVVDGETGFLVPMDPMNEAPFEPREPETFERGLAARINQLMADPALCQKFGRAGRKRAEEKFGWPAIAEQTKALYEKLLMTKHE
jgi:glycosyltransferase involved in cell wall biosynthesis